MINQPLQVDPITGMPLPQPLADQQQALAPQIPSNELGNAAPVFNPSAVAKGNDIYGLPAERQSTMIR